MGAAGSQRVHGAATHNVYCFPTARLLVHDRHDQTDERCDCTHAKYSAPESCQSQERRRRLHVPCPIIRDHHTGIQGRGGDSGNDLEGTGFSLTSASLLPCMSPVLAWVLEDWTLPLDSTCALPSQEADDVQIYLAMEEKEDKSAFKAQNLISTFDQSFYKMSYTIHPAGIPGEAQGKSSNESWAGKQACKDYPDAALKPNIIMTTMDGQ